MRAAAGTHMPQLDGLRAIAVAMVAVFHWHHPQLLGEVLPLHMGVDVFFVLSGFLITGILLRVRSRIDGGLADRLFALRAFWARRFLRLLPALVVYLAVAGLIGEIADGDGLLWYLGYLGNLRILQLGYWPEGTAHLWSLAVEEQFYIMMPLLMLWLPRRLMTPFFAVGIGVSLISFATTPTALHILPPTAFGALFTGCLAAVFFETHHDNDAALRCSRLGAPLLLIAILVGAHGPTTAIVAVGNELLLFVATGALTWRAAVGGAGAMLEARPLQWMGRASYAIYLWHFTGMNLGVEVVGATAPWPVRLGLATTVTLALAYASEVLVERRFMRRKANHPYVRPDRPNRRRTLSTRPDRRGVRRPAPATASLDPWTSTQPTSSSPEQPAASAPPSHGS